MSRGDAIVLLLFTPLGVAAAAATCWLADRVLVHRLAEQLWGMLLD